MRHLHHHEGKHRSARAGRLLKRQPEEELPDDGQPTRLQWPADAATSHPLRLLQAAEPESGAGAAASLTGRAPPAPRRGPRGGEN